MTRRDYILIADIVRTTLADYPTIRRAIAFRFSDALKADNGNFDRQKFLDACGVVL